MKLIPFLHRSLSVAALFVLMLLLTHRAAHAQDAQSDSSFLKNGDRWLFVGDSITHADTYRQALLRVLQHHHPDADILVGNSAVSGVTSDYKADRPFVPTVVTIMLGMNDVIHQDHAFAPDLKAKIEAYRASITKQVRQFQQQGAQVILMTPTYTDERFSTYFNVASTRRFLEAFGQVVREVAQAENCHWVPVAEELEAFQDTQPADRHFRPDGVHPYGPGQYQIARTLWQRMNFAGPLTGERRMVRDMPAELPITVRLAKPFMHQPTDGVALEIQSSTPRQIIARWSLGQQRGESKLQIGPDAVTSWKPEIPATALEVPLGDQRQIVVELIDGAARKICLVDLGRTRVMTLNNGVASGEIVTTKDRPEGSVVARWKLDDRGDELWFSGEVLDDMIHSPAGWPFMRDSVSIWLDPRPAPRFAHPNPDRDVVQLILAVRETPSFSVTPIPWLSPRLIYAVDAGGQRTDTGYRWHCVIGGSISTVRKTNLKSLDYFSFNLSVCDHDAGKSSTFHFYRLFETTSPNPVQDINRQIILDRKGKFPGDQTTTLSLFP